MRNDSENIKQHATVAHRVGVSIAVVAAIAGVTAFQKDKHRQDSAPQRPQMVLTDQSYAESQSRSSCNFTQFRPETDELIVSIPRGHEGILTDCSIQGSSRASALAQGEQLGCECDAH